MYNAGLFDLIRNREIQTKISLSELKTFIRNDLELSHEKIIESLENSRLYSYYLQRFIDDDLPQLTGTEFVLDIFVTQLSQYSLIQSLVRACKKHNVQLSVKIIGQNNSVSTKLAQAQLQSIKLLDTHNIKLNPSPFRYAA